MQMDACLPDRPLALVLDATPAHALAKETRAALEAAGAEVIGLTPKGHNPIPGDFAVYRDASGLLSRGPFAALVGHVLLLRRDRYIAATEPIATAASLAAHINHLAPAGRGETGVRTKKARPA
jgi:3-(3-hydroxy-phenyl)propionate hydroxylase